MFNDVFAIPFDRQMWFIAVVIWTLAWKGMGMWKAAKKGSKPWFIAFLILNTLGILEILYLYVFSEPRPKKEKSS
ncbi:MAG TPA: DUF5652 family protein [Candidatus Paceibacterota bacterium]|nr:DUF5652 family protein [Candidatus Paceibacterota bacterium]